MNLDQKLSYEVYDTQHAPSAVVFIVHGMQEHKERYRTFAEYLASKNYAVITYDLPGHGMTAGSPDNMGWFGEENGWKNLVDSAVDIAAMAHQKYPDIPVIYFGHSMGTMIGRVFLQTHEDLIDAMILSGAPCYNGAAGLAKVIDCAVSAFKGKRGHSAMIDNLATGSFNKGIENPRTPLDWLSYNTDNVDAYIADPGDGFPFTIRGYYDLFELMQKMHDVSAYQCHKPDMPILFFSGQDDPCRGGDKGFEDSIDVLKEAGYHSVEHRLYPHMRHETLHEDDAASVMKDTAEWIAAQIKA
jgi:alpha-beta hydrolase superfamily lysophospholipase